MPLIATLAATLSLGVSPAQPAQAQAVTPQDTADLQCLAVSMLMSGMAQDESIRTGLMAASTFYLGRLEGRTPTVVWLDRLTDYIKTVSQADMQSHTPRCGAEINAMGQRIQTWSAALAAEAPAPAPAQ